MKEALNTGELIITADQDKDSRKYRQEEEKPVGTEKQVVVIQEAKPGRNEIFLDTSKGIIMSRSNLASQIEQGNYPGYTIAMIQNLATPMSKPDESPSNNLG